MNDDEARGVQEDERLEDLPRVDEGGRSRADGYGLDSNHFALPVESDREEVLAVETLDLGLEELDDVLRLPNRHGLGRLIRSHELDADPGKR